MKPTAAVARSRRATWNPLACSDTLLRPNTLLMAKLSWLLLLVGGFARELHESITPGVGVLANVPGGTGWLAVAFWIGGAFLLCNRLVRAACALVGGAVLLLPFESITAWHPFAWVCGGVLLLSALQGPGDEPRFARWFVIIVHAAAALAAVDGAGWVGTALTESWSGVDFVGVVPRWLENFLPHDALAEGLRWGSIVICAAIPLGLLVPRLRRTSAALALLFHTLLYLALGSTEVLLFAGAIAVAQISCLTWPRFVLVVWPRACGWPLSLRTALDRYDFERRTDWPRPPDPDAELEAWFDLQPLAGARAIVNLVLCFPVFYFVLLLAFAVTHAVLPRFLAVTLISATSLVLLGFSAYAALSGLYARIRKRPPPPLPDPEADVATANPETAPATATPASDANPAVDVTDVTVEIDTPRPPDR